MIHREQEKPRLPRQPAKPLPVINPHAAGIDVHSDMHMVCVPAERAAPPGEDNGEAHLKNLILHHQIILPITEGRLDLGPWQQVFYAEFDGRRPKRLVIKVIGE